MAYKKLTLDVIIPAYNGGKTIRDTLGSLLSQSFSDFRVIIHDDCSTDNTEAVVKSFNDPRITFFKNKYNLTCQKNIEAARQKSKADIVYFLCQDDILSEDALIDAYNAFTLSDDIGAVVRPYFWFDEKINNPVRAISRLDLNKDEVVTINDDYSRIKVFIDALLFPKYSGGIKEIYECLKNAINQLNKEKMINQGRPHFKIRNSPSR